MAASATHLTHSIRLAFRIDLGEYSTQQLAVDASVPASSTLAEAIPTITDLAEAPLISVPWLARTAGGDIIDLTAPLAHAGLKHGDVIVLSPWEDIDPPVKKDAAEALADLGVVFSPQGLAGAAAVIGLLGTGYLCAISQLPTVPPTALFALATLVTMCLAAWIPYVAPSQGFARGCYFTLSAFGAGVTLWTLITGDRIPERLGEVGWLGAASISAAGGVALLMWWLARPHLTVVVAVLTMCALGIASSATLLVVESFEAALAATVGCCFAVLIAAPGLAAMLAGLRVPALPAAGQDLRVADHSVPDPELRALRATMIVDGVCTGCGIVVSGAVITLAVSVTQPAFVAALSLSSAAAVALHAARHRSLVSMWGLWLWTLASLVASMLASVAAGPGGVLAAFVATILTVTAPLWAHRVRELSPTAFNWLEKAEGLALAAVFPLSAHLAGLFDAIRGLG